MSAGLANDVEVTRIATLLHDEIGLPVGPSSSSRLHRCVRDGAAARRLTVAAYADEIMLRDAAWQDLLNRVTVQETAFFRHPEQFDVLTRVVFPDLRPPVRIWSAGCANGQEAFTLAMLLDEHGLDGSVLATDVSTAALERTSVGRYSARELRGLSPDRIGRYLMPAGHEWKVDDQLRDRVTTARHNLVDSLPPQAGSFQVIFCRNILIYLSPLHVRSFLDRLAVVLAPGSVMFLGAAEVLSQVGSVFEPVQVGTSFFYRRRTIDAPSPRSPVSATTAVLRTVASPGPSPSSAMHGALRVAARSGSLRARTSQDRPERSVARTPPRMPDEDGGTAAALALTKVGQHATAAGNHDSAVVAFRACTYLMPHDAIAHLHLGLALEATGDRPAATRTFGVARRVLLATDPELIERDSEGFTFGELLSLLDTKRQLRSP